MTALIDPSATVPSTEPPAVVHVVDDDPGMRDSLRELLESVALEVQCHPDAETFLAGWDPARPGCVVLDLRMPRMSGLELQHRLAAAERVPPIIFLTGHGSVASAVRAMKAGAVDFLAKPVEPEELLERIRSAIATDRAALAEHEQLAELRRRREQLTQREVEVFRMTARGLSNKEVARGLAIAPKTAELHRAHVMKKMDVHSAAELARIAIHLGEPDRAGDDSD